jgi:hypothetical protein
MQNKIIITILSCFIVIDVIMIFIALTMTPFKLKRNCFTFEYGETIPTTADNYVNASDSILKSIKLNMKNVSTEVGTYQASFEYFNKVYPFTIEVVDTIKPKVQLKQVEFNIQVGKKIYAKDLIKEIKDLSKTTVYFYDEDTKTYSKSKSYTTPGSYIERIIVEDQHGNQSAALRVKIVVSLNTVKPKLSGISDITIKVNSTFNPLSGVKATDDLEGDITSRIIVSGQVDTTKPGVYEITYSVKDSAGNKLVKVRKVTVEE